MMTLLKNLVEHGPVILDGALGTQLQNQGLHPGESPESWNRLHPDIVADIARAYADAGSQVVLTNTFGGNRIALKKYGLESSSGELNRLGVELAKRGAAGRALVFGSIGPSGGMVLRGDVTANDLREAFAMQAEELAAAGADALVIETMSDLEEAGAAVAAAHATGLPTVVCMSYDSGKHKDRTMMGVTPELAAETLTGAGADVIGMNCGQGIAGSVVLCERLRKSTPLPIWVKPNAGLPQLVEGKVIYRETPEEFASYIPALVKAGASFLGGCCGTTPAFIRAICVAVR